MAVFRTLEGRTEAYGGVANILTDAEGSRGASPHRGVGDPGSFTLIVEWDSVKAHTALTQQPEFRGFGDAVRPCLVDQPEVRHMEDVT
jgi:quinol monooxygenase YgiN